jgi:hypothetical protein
MMFVMSLCALPLALFDLLFVPAYWAPITLFNVPVGLEGFVYSFSMGGVASVLYAELAGRSLRHVQGWHTSVWHALWVPFLTFIAFVIAAAFHGLNPMAAAYTALALGVALTMYVRKDLARSALIGALSFGAVYFVALKLWLLAFPDASSWFMLQHLPRVTVLGVPGPEILYGVLFGAYWSNLYELLFRYAFVRQKAGKKHAEFAK